MECDIPDLFVYLLLYCADICSWVFDFHLLQDHHLVLQHVEMKDAGMLAVVWFSRKDPAEKVLALVAQNAVGLVQTLERRRRQHLAENEAPISIARTFRMLYNRHSL